MKTFKIQWVSGRVEFLKGIDILTALVDARHSKSAIRAIKKYEEVIMKKEVDSSKSKDCSAFKKFLVEEVSEAYRPTSKQRSKAKRINRRACNKMMDKLY